MYLCHFGPNQVIRQDREDGSYTIGVPFSSARLEVSPKLQSRVDLFVDGEPAGIDYLDTEENRLKFLEQFIPMWHFRSDQSLSDCFKELTNKVRNGL